MSLPDYSTTRLLVDEMPVCFDVLVDDFKSKFRLPSRPDRYAEDGLRLSGGYKISRARKPLITVLTVVYNGVDYIEATLRSVLKQTYDNVEYIVIDGGSVDGTIDVINGYGHVLDYWVSEPDAGMYDALTKGFSLASGDIICYLNAGDFYFEGTLETVANIYVDTGCYWFTGLRSVCNESNVVTRVDQPFRYQSPLIRQGFYGRRLPYIQQESTFWHRKLFSFVDFEKFSKMRFAGDYYLWFCFSQSTNLSVVSAQLGVFKIHKGQLSEALDKYWLEVDAFRERIGLLGFLLYFQDLPLWALSSDVRKYFYKGYYSYSHELGRWCKN